MNNCFSFFIFHPLLSKPFLLEQPDLINILSKCSPSRNNFVFQQINPYEDFIVLLFSWQKFNAFLYSKRNNNFLFPTRQTSRSYFIFTCIMRLAKILKWSVLSFSSKLFFSSLLKKKVIKKYKNQPLIHQLFKE